MQSFGNDWFCNDKTTYAKEVGRLDVYLEKGLVSRVKFDLSDTSAYSRILPLLIAKYGPAQTVDNYSQTWKNDSTNLELNKYRSVSLTLKRNGFLD